MRGVACRMVFEKSSQLVSAPDHVFDKRLRMTQRFGKLLSLDTVRGNVSLRKEDRMVQALERCATDIRRI